MEVLAERETSIRELRCDREARLYLEMLRNDRLCKLSPTDWTGADLLTGGEILAPQPPWQGGAGLLKQERRTSLPSPPQPGAGPGHGC